MSMLKKLFKLGWRIVTEVHTVLWIVVDILGVTVPASAIAAATAWFGEHSIAILCLVFAVTAAASFVGLLVFLGYRAERNKASALQKGAANSEAATHTPKPTSPKLRISTGEDRPLAETKSRSMYDKQRTLNLKVENTDSEAAVTDIKVSILNIEPQSEYVGPWILTDGFSLAAGDHRLIPLASYGEAPQENYSTSAYDRSDSDFEILVTKNQPILSKTTPQMILIRATGIGSALCDYRCKIWVDETGRLRIKDTEAPPDEEISLLEAATRAHEQLRNRPISIPVEAFAKTPDDILLGYCRMLAFPQGSNPARISLRGIKPPARTSEQILISHNWDFEMENGTVILREHFGSLRYEKVTASAREVKTAIDELGQLEV
jgi:hypothetical protein